MTRPTSRLPANAARLLLGLAFTVFGANGFLQFLPVGQPSEAGAAFLGALAATGYLFPLIKGTELVAGLLLLANRAVPLALVLLAPILVNVLAYHAWLSPGLGLPLLLTGLEVYVAYVHRQRFRPLFVAAPAGPPPLVESLGRGGAASAA